jgi:hypothetical protein
MATGGGIVEVMNRVRVNARNKNGKVSAYLRVEAGKGGLATRFACCFTDCLKAASLTRFGVAFPNREPIVFTDLAGRVLAPAGHCRALRLCLCGVFVRALGGFLTVNFRRMRTGCTRGWKYAVSGRTPTIASVFAWSTLALMRGTCMVSQFLNDMELANSAMCVSAVLRNTDRSSAITWSLKRYIARSSRTA